MKLFNAVLALAASSLVVAQQYTSADIPECANSCFQTASPEVGCSVTDQSCQCDKSKELREKVTPCVTTSCSLEDALKTSDVTNGLCAALSSSKPASGTSTTTATSGSSSSGSATASATAAAAATANVAAAGGARELGGLGLVLLAMAAL